MTGMNVIDVFMLDSSSQSVEMVYSNHSERKKELKLKNWKNE